LCRCHWRISNYQSRKVSCLLKADVHSFKSVDALVFLQKELRKKEFFECELPEFLFHYEGVEVLPWELSSSV
jgi:hypothetical protein